jgi:hypothetical protein
VRKAVASCVAKDEYLSVILAPFEDGDVYHEFIFAKSSVFLEDSATKKPVHC